MLEASIMGTHCGHSMFNQSLDEKSGIFLNFAQNVVCEYPSFTSGLPHYDAMFGVHRNRLCYK